MSKSSNSVKTPQSSSKILKSGGTTKDVYEVSDEFADEEGGEEYGKKVMLFDLGPEDSEAEQEQGSDPKEVVLSKEMLRQGLSMIGRTVDNFQYAYIRFDGSNKNLSNVDTLAEYLHLRILILSENRLRNLLPLCTLKHILVLNAHTNEIESFEEIPTWPYLQALSLMSNRLSSLKGLYANHIVYLQLSFNGFDKLEEFNGSTFYALRTLELRGNQLSSFKSLSIPTLEHLFAAQNNLKEISDLNCPNLVTLHLRDNEIRKLDQLPSLPKLKYLNLRSNLVSRFTQTAHLDKAPNLGALILMENPICGSEVYRVEMIAVLPLLTRIDKLLCPEAELIQGRSLRLGRQKNVEGVAPLTDDPNIVTPRPSATNTNYMDADEYEGEGSRVALPAVGSTSRPLNSQIKL